MDADKIVSVLTILGARQFKVVRNEVVSTCVFEQSKHDGGFDRVPSLSVNVETGVWQCFGCHKTGKSLRGLVWQWCAEYGHDYGMFKQQFDEDDRLDGIRREVDFVNGQRYEDRRVRRREVSAEFKERLKRVGLDAVEVGPDGAELTDKADDSVAAHVKECAGKIPKYVVNRGIPVDVAKEAGLGYDKARKRVVFPILGIDGSLVGCATRGLEKTGDYKFNPGFKKSYHLYLERETFVNPKVAALVLTEGQFDALKVRSFGYNGVATLGSSLSPEQAAVASKLCETIAQKFQQVALVIMMDGDKAGEDAADKMVEALKDFPFPVRRAKLDEGKDPADLTWDEFQVAVIKAKWVNEVVPQTQNDSKKEEPEEKVIDLKVDTEEKPQEGQECLRGQK